MASLKAYFANLPGMGDAITRYTTKTRKGWRHDRFSFKLDGYRVQLRQDRNYLPYASKHRGLQGRFVHTTNVVIRDVSASRVAYVRKLLEDLASLLSFATLSGVTFYGFEYPLGSGHGQRWAARGAYHRFRPMLANLADASVTDFVHQTWDEFRRLKGDRRLGTTFNYLVEADRADQPLELRLLCSFVALEGLKHSYAKTSGIPFRKGRFRDPQGDALSFQKLLKEMMKSVGIERDVKRIIDLRNELFHSSISELSFDAQWRLYEASMELSQEYLLRLLGYKGYYRAHGLAVRRLT